MPAKIAALYVSPTGSYANLPDVDCWDEARDAREYLGPYPVVAHPPCQRWGRFWHGSPSKPHQFSLGQDGGCFAYALSSVRAWGGVLEPPCDSKAWAHHGITPPKRYSGWQPADSFGGWTCYVEQGHYGHPSRKATWLYACHTDLPELNWTKGEQRLCPITLERHGYEVARRRGVISAMGGKAKTEMREKTPEPFRDILIAMARSVSPEKAVIPRLAASQKIPTRRDFDELFR